MRPIACLFAALVAVAAVAAAPAGVTFVDITTPAGIRFVHNNGAFGKNYMPETYGSGCAFLDVAGDDRQDLFFANSTKFPGQPGEPGWPFFVSRPERPVLLGSLVSSS